MNHTFPTNSVMNQCASLPKNDAPACVHACAHTHTEKRKRKSQTLDTQVCT